LFNQLVLLTCHMKKSVVILLLLCISQFSFSQNCTPDSIYQYYIGIWPDTIVNIPCGYGNMYYQTVVNFTMPTEANQIDSLTYPPGIPINWVRIDTVSGLPNGVTYLTNAASNTPPDQWNGGEQGCLTVYGQAPTGVYPLSIDVMGEAVVNGFAVPVPISFGGYYLRLYDYQDTINTVICPGDSVLIDTNYQTNPGIYNHNLCGSPVVTVIEFDTSTSVSVNVTICNGDSLFVGGAYQTTTGAYTDIVGSTGTGCDSTIVTYLDVDVPSIPTISQSGSDLTASTGASYQWYLDGTELTGETSQTISALQAGVYTVAVTNTNGCTATSDPITILGVSGNWVVMETKIFPNPFTETTTVSFSNPENIAYELRAYNMLGKEVRSVQGITSEEYVFEKGALLPGIYLVHLIGKGVDYKGRLILSK
jgi:hypothetical protein